MDLTLILSAISLAAMYGLMAIGTSLTWSSLGMLNLAGAFTFAASGYGAWKAAQHISENPAVVLIAGAVSGAMIGILVAALAFVPLHDRPHFAQRSLIVTLAINLTGTQLLLEWFGPQAKSLPSIFGREPLRFLGATMGRDRAGAVIVAVTVLAVVVLWARYSRRGLQMLAMMQDPMGAAMVGVSVRATAVGVLALSGALVGLSAVLLSQTFFVAPSAGFQPFVRGLVVALLGGLGSIRGAMVAAVVIGVAEALTARHLGGHYILIVIYVLVIGVLTVRPRGLGGLLDETRE